MKEQYSIPSVKIPLIFWDSLSWVSNADLLEKYETLYEKVLIENSPEFQKFLKDREEKKEKDKEKGDKVG